MHYLTPAEIASIQGKASRSQMLRMENIISIGGKLTDIINLSAHHGLILIYGNEETGFEHIRMRHELYSGQTYWKTSEDGTTKLDYPSKFAPHSIPIIDYIAIADALYAEEFLNIVGNKVPEMFDFFEGKPSIDLAENRRFKMLYIKELKLFIHCILLMINISTKKNQDSI
jgi:hypothetical protein